MANLRELRKRAKELGIEYTKDDSKEVLEEMIVAKECDTEAAAEKEAASEAVAEKEAAEEATEKKTEMEDAPSAETKKPGKKALPGTGGSFGNFGDDLQIYESDLQKEFMEQPGKYAFYAQQAATANSKMLTSKMRMEVVEAELYKKIKDELVDAGAKPTEKMISSEMLVRDEWKSAQKSYIKAQEAYKIAKAAMDAMEHRRDMLIQLGSSARQERNQIGLDLHAKAKETLGKAA